MASNIHGQNWPHILVHIYSRSEFKIKTTTNVEYKCISPSTSPVVLQFLLSYIIALYALVVQYLVSSAVQKLHTNAN